MVTILGLSAFYHDSAAALIVDGDIVAAAQEERFSRKKHDPGYPGLAVDYVLAEAGIGLSEVDHVAFYDKPFLKFERLLETFVATAPRGFRSFRTAMPVWLREKLFQKNMLARLLSEHDGGFDAKRLLFAEHHFSHAASAFYPSPFEEALVLTLDGVGEWATGTVAIGRGRNLEIIKEMRFPHSLGLLYSAFTYYVGFKVNSGEYKLMGLAPYGVPRFKDLILERLLDLKKDGSFRLDMSYFNYLTGLEMTGRKFEQLFGMPARKPESELLTDFHMDVAASIQAVTEEIMLRMARSLAAEHRMQNLCLAGGVALNCVANGRLLRDGAFRDIWIQPASGDAGGSLGAALAAWHDHLGHERSVNRRDAMKGAFLGPEYSQREISRALRRAGAVFEELPTEVMLEVTAKALAEGQAVGWFQGRMEFGPRALGARSILGDPRQGGMQKNLNLKVKFRESFRPFAPSVLRDRVGDWFELDGRLAVHAPGRRRPAGASARHDQPGAGAVRDRQAQRQAFGHPGGDACRLLRPHPDGAPRYQSDLSRAARAVLCDHGLSSPDQHVLQRPWRAHRQYAGGCVPLLHGHGPGLPRLRQCGSVEEPANCGGEHRIPGAVRA